MKKILPLIILCFISISMLAQNSGRGISYQAVARDANGNIRKSENIELRFSLLKESSTGTVYWSERHNVNTDAYGTFAVIIGTGTKDECALDEFTDVSFHIHYWLKIEIMENTTWVEVSNQALLSSPYAENTVPVGSIIPFAGPVDNIPEGWELCDGTALNSSEYPALWSAIGQAWGDGTASPDGTIGNFNLPDLRGLFLRGVSHLSNNDPNKTSRNPSSMTLSGQNTGNLAGSLQDNATKLPNTDFETDNSGNHTHSETRIPKGNVWYSRYSWGGGHITEDNFSYQSVATGEGGSHTHKVTTGGDDETRPKNAYVNYIIKVK